MSSATAALRTLAIIAGRGGVTVTELSRELGISTSSAHRILATCRGLGFVRQDHAGGPYLPGQAMHELAMSSTSAVSLRDASFSVLEQLRDLVGETVSLLVFEGRHVRFVQALEGASTVRVGSRLGRTIAAHAVSGGKAMLALETPARLEQRFPGRHLERLTSRTITDWDALLVELADIRRRGWSVTVGESDLEISGVGAAITTGSGDPIAAVTVAVPASRLATPEAGAALVPPVLAAAEAIQRRIRGERLAVTNDGALPA